MRAQLDKLLADIENHKLYPNGPGDDPRQFVKGSVVLDMLFAAYGIRYDKKKVGRLIATKISYENQPLLKDIWDLFPRDFLPYK